MPERRRVQTKLGLALSLGVVLCGAEVLGGLFTGSLALVSDAAHVFLHVVALGLSYVALRLASRPPNPRYTYGYHRLQVLAALANGGMLVALALGIFREAWSRLWEPAPILAGPMLGIAAAGLGANLVMAWLLHQHDHDDINLRSAFLHLLGDILGSIGAITAGVVILFTGWTPMDAVVSFSIGALIFASAAWILKRSVHILAEGVPEGLSATQVQKAMSQVPGVSEVHDLHVWTLGPGYVALSAHVVLADQALSTTETVMRALKGMLSTQFGIHHTTIQFECRNCQGDVSCPGPVCPVPADPAHRDPA